MGLISGRVVLAVIALCVGLGLALATGFVKLEGDSYRCAFGKGWENVGERQVLWSVSKLHFYYQPKRWGCPVDEQYDPKKFRNEDGFLSPVQTPGSPGR